jgi:hypothetical protein
VEENNIIIFIADVSTTIDDLSISKAIGVDNIPSEFYNNKDIGTLIINKLTEQFASFLRAGEAPEHFMRARLVLISKSKDELPEIF